MWIVFRQSDGYGPVILAGAEMYKMTEGNKFTLNDSSLQYAE
jgi:hypothetical protein